MSKEVELTIKEAAERKNIPIPTLKSYCRQGKFPNARLEKSPIGDYWVIPLSELETTVFRARGRPSKKKEASNK
jgi:hypothetical protein